LSTRILEKDYYKPEYPCVSEGNITELPSHNFMNPSGINQCNNLNSCGNIIDKS